MALHVRGIGPEEAAPHGHENLASHRQHDPSRQGAVPRRERLARGLLLKPVELLVPPRAEEGVLRIPGGGDAHVPEVSRVGKSGGALLERFHGG